MVPRVDVEGSSGVARGRSASLSSHSSPGPTPKANLSKQLSNPPNPCCQSPHALPPSPIAPKHHRLPARHRPDHLVAAVVVDAS